MNAVPRALPAGYWRVAAVTAPVYFGVLIMRGWSSLDRLPADPGYGWVLRASQEGVSSIFGSDPYYRLQEFSSAWLVSYFPVNLHALLLTLSSHFVWALCASAVCWVAKPVVRSWSLAVLLGFLVVLVPHASESALGNYGNVRWVLMTALMVLIAVPPDYRHDGAGITSFGLLNALSNPIAGVCLFPIAARSLFARQIHQADKKLVGWMAIGVVAQLLRAVSNGLLGGYNAKVRAPWGGMGVFWWSGLVGPIAIAVVTLLVTSLNKRLTPVVGRFAQWLAIMSIAIHVVSYLLGGIADRYFVAPMALSLMALMLGIHELFPHRRIMRSVALLSVTFLVAIPVLKWFSSSSYLASGPSWRSSVERARSNCDSDDAPIQGVALSPNSTQLLSCGYLIGPKRG